MARETLKDFLRSINSTSDRITFKVNPPDGDPNSKDLLGRGSDLGIDPNSGEELLNLEKETVGLLGDYVSFIMNKSNNVFPVAGKNSQAASTKRGDNIIMPSSGGEHGAVKVFVDDPLKRSKLEEYSDSSNFNIGNSKLQDIVNKTGDGSNHYLLHDVQGRPLNRTGKTLASKEGEENKAIKGVNNILRNYNRFANVKKETAFAPDNTLTSEFDRKENESGTFTNQNSYGTYNKNSNNLNYDELKNIAASMLYKASGYDKSGIPGLSENVDKLENKIESEVNIPDNYSNDGFEKIPFANVRSMNAESAPKNSNGYSTREGRGRAGLLSDNADNINNNKTFGSTYNQTVHFFGKNHKIHKIKATIAAKSLMIIAERFYGKILEYFKSVDAANGNEKKTNILMFGKFKSLLNLRLDYIKQSLLVKTKYPYKDCVDRGLQVIFSKNSDPKQNDDQRIIQSRVFQSSPGFWLAISNSVLKAHDQIIKGLDEIGEISDKNEMINYLISVMGSNKLIQFYNTMATIGDVSLRYTTGMPLSTRKKDIVRPKDVERYPDTPGNRVAKSKKRNGLTSRRLAIAQNDVPSAYLLPTNIVRASARMNEGNFGPNPVRGMLGSELVENTYMSFNADGSGGRIPNDVVKSLEDRLDAEYVPFYIQDLRTNEVISFHAFLTGLNDSISTNFTGTSGYGRMDKVQIYSDTSRKVSVDFTLFATSREDFNTMWYKINKITTLFYPQWSQGTKVSNGEGSVFVQPFSQVIGASPIVRLRVGDVIKSNYSRFNFGRSFGIGDPNVTPMVVNSEMINANSALQNADNGALGGLNNFNEAMKEIMVKIFLMIFGSPTQYLNLEQLDGNHPQADMIVDAFSEALNNQLKNGFVNPLTLALVMNQLKDPNTEYGVNSYTNLDALDSLDQIVDGVKGVADFLGAGSNNNFGYHKERTFNVGDVDVISNPVVLKANNNTGYNTEDGGKIYSTRTLKIQIIDRVTQEKIRYKVKVFDPGSPVDQEIIICDHEDILPDPEHIFANTGMGFFIALSTGPTALLDYLVSLAGDTMSSMGIGGATVDVIRSLYMQEELLFLHPENNPFTRAYESTIGRGLAGTLSGISFNWLDKFPWETDHNSRAPIGCSLKFDLTVIHDIPPGIDHSGYNRAPLYNVGDIMKHIAGDPYQDNGMMSEFRYRNSGNVIKTGEK